MYRRYTTSKLVGYKFWYGRFMTEILTTVAVGIALYAAISARIARSDTRQRQHTDGAKRDLGKRIDRVETWLGERIDRAEERLLKAIHSRVPS